MKTEQGPFRAGHSWLARWPNGSPICCSRCPEQLQLESRLPAIFEEQGQWKKHWYYQCPDHYINVLTFTEPAEPGDVAA
jgi:hypothetical protein